MLSGFDISIFNVRQYVWLILSCFILPVSLMAQPQHETAISGGFNIPVSKTYPDLPEPAIGVSYALVSKVPGKFNQYYYRNQRLCLTAQFHGTGNRKVLGDAISVCPQMEFTANPRHKVQFHFRLGLGLAYLTRHYDKIKTPGNTAIGTAINLNGEMRGYIDIPFSDKIQGILGVGLTHYSNGAWSNPNLGINIPMAFAGIRFGEKSSPTVKKGSRPLDVLYSYKVSGFARAGVGFTELGYDGHKTITRYAAAGVFYHWRPVSKFRLGFEYLFNPGARDFQVYTGQDEAEAIRQSRRYNIFAGHELIFGNLSFLLEGGVYLNKHYAQKSKFSTRIGMMYYPRNHFRNDHFLPYVGFAVRAYSGLAEMVECNIGFDF